jgi:2-keto-3-deoxy-L-rhamnonate aldolase RhmA
LTLKKKLKQKELTIGSWLSFGYTPICEIMANSGFEWLVIDMEHTAIDQFASQQLMQIISLAGSVPLVRVGKNDDLLIKRAMDSGAHGVVVPMVNSKEEALRAVEHTLYPPIGKRGVGLSRAQNYGTGFAEYKQWLENESVIIVQIEHITAVERLSEIMSVDHIDGFIIGPYDLSASLGLPGQFEHPTVKAALDEVKRFVRSSTKPGGYHVVHSNPASLEEKIREGYSFIAYGDDMVFFSEKIAAEEAHWKKHLK